MLKYKNKSELIVPDYSARSSAFPEKMRVIYKYRLDHPWILLSEIILGKNKKERQFVNNLGR